MEQHAEPARILVPSVNNHSDIEKVYSIGRLITLHFQNAFVVILQSCMTLKFKYCSILIVFLYLFPRRE